GDLMSAGGESSAEGNSLQIAGGDKAVDGNQNFTDKNSADKTLAEKNSPAQKTDDDANTPEDIMEKYIWTIRALEDEWAKFTNSKEYKDLPNNLTDKKFLNRRPLDAATAYRRAMTA
ncbi:MAG: hypothetical protein IJT47_03700, partial [Selenomonadaceae bacterium]|nr:hypothetical protein [Selenomonadaceae bacterium]